VGACWVFIFVVLCFLRLVKPSVVGVIMGTSQEICPPDATAGFALFSLLGHVWVSAL
jgi:hypothetical protein